MGTLITTQKTLWQVKSAQDAFLTLTSLNGANCYCLLIYFFKSSCSQL